MVSESVLRTPSSLGTQNRKQRSSGALLQSLNRGDKSPTWGDTSQNRGDKSLDRGGKSQTRGGRAAVSPGGTPPRRAAAALRGGDHFSGTIQAAKDPPPAQRAAGGALGSAGPTSGRELPASGLEGPALGLGASARFQRAFFVDSRMASRLDSQVVATSSAPLSGRYTLKPEFEYLSQIGVLNRVL